MKHLVIVALILFSGAVRADDFAPTVLNIKTNPVFIYDCDDSILNFPVSISGTSATVFFCIYTRDRSNEIGSMASGYLGWHSVNRVDTCIYYSAPYNFDPGEHIIHWDRTTKNGDLAPWTDLTLYIWGYDNRSEPRLACRFIPNTGAEASITEIDEEGLPLVHPLIYIHDSRWTIGNDPENESLLETSNVIAPDGWRRTGRTTLLQDDYNYYYFQMISDSSLLSSVSRYKWVPGGNAEISMDFGPWGFYGLAEPFPAIPGDKPGVSIYEEYIFVFDSNVRSTDEPRAGLYIYNYDGEIVKNADISPWWSSPESFAEGGVMNGGPDVMNFRDGLLFLGGSASCLVQMMDPIRFLDSGAVDDLIVWGNGNGDYILDRNFEETAARPWVCNDIDADYSIRGIAADDLSFSIVPAGGPDSGFFALFGPDGTGLGHLTLGGTHPGNITGCNFVDRDTAYDGIYFHVWNDEADSLAAGTWFVAHDSVMGILASNNFGITVQNPAHKEILTAGDVYTISWSSDIPYIETPTRIDFFDGETWRMLTDELEPEIRSFEWTVPELDAVNCLIRVSNDPISRHFDYSGVFSIRSDTAVTSSLPTVFSLGRSHPNPFNSATTIPFTLARECHVRVDVYNITGEKAVTLVIGRLPAGRHETVWNAGGFPSGVYFVRFEAEGQVETGKVTLVK